MAFILGREREGDVAAAFRAYDRYLTEHRHRFPPGAYALATADWYFNPEDHRCPHDAWLQHIVVHETGEGSRHEERSANLSIQLLGAYHDLVLTFTYTGLHRYVLEGTDVTRGHMDWRYDEFRLSDVGNLIHEIEWCGAHETGRWLLEATDVRLEWGRVALDA